MEYSGKNWCRTDSGWGVCSSELEIKCRYNSFNQKYHKVVKLQREKIVTFHSHILVKLTISAWNIMAKIGAKLIVDGELAQVAALLQVSCR